MKQNKKKASIAVITVVLNRNDVISKTIESVLSQSGDIQYIVIDGCSSDGTVEKIEKYKSGIDVFVSESDLGIYHAMNKGLFYVNADWVYFLNAGDVLEIGAFSFFLNAVRPNVDVYCGLTNIKYKYSLKISCWNLYWRFMPPHQGVFARQETLKDGFNLKYKLCADYNWLIETIKKGFQVQHINITIANFELGGVSSNTSLLLSEIFEVQSNQFGFIAPLVRKSILYFLMLIKNQKK